MQISWFELSTVGLGFKDKHIIKNNKLHVANIKVNNHNKQFPNKTVVIDESERSTLNFPKSVSLIQVEECSVEGRKELQFNYFRQLKKIK